MLHDHRQHPVCLDDAAEAEDEGEEFEEGDVEGEEAALVSTAELYAARERERERERIAAEREANVRAQTGAVQTIPVEHRHAAQLAQPHRYADRWQKPAS